MTAHCAGHRLCLCLVDDPVMIFLPALDNPVDKSVIFVGLSIIVSISYFQETNRSIASKKSVI